MPGAAFLRGNRVVLRTIEEEDIEMLQRARNEPALRDMGNYPANLKTIETEYEDQSEANEDDTRLLICIDEEPAGFVRLFDIRSGESGTLAYWLLPEYQGNGYATEGAGLLIDHAFQNLALHRIFAWTIDDNEVSQAVLRRLGFSHEGTHREDIFRKGGYHDTEHYGLLVSEWEGYDGLSET